ncbi:MAG: putative FAD-dependent dehydrogenase, partial [Myxococcota bacterium]
ALYLAEAGASVTLLERGDAVQSRVRTVNGWWRGSMPLDAESNLVFGEGGAGTFSDGKIYTRRRDGELGFIFRRLVDFGAAPEVMREAWAHLGTDKIRALLPPFRERLQELGVDVRFGACVQRLIVEAGRCVGVSLTSGEEVRGGPVLVGVGHSARDGLRMMVDAGAKASARGIAVGVRVEHPQELIDEARYGRPERGDLPPASYRLTHAPPGGARRAHTFCMCPGGMVVPATNHAGRVVVNGMSFAARRAFWANSAVIAEVSVGDFERDLGRLAVDDPLIGLDWQDRVETRAFDLGGKNYSAPSQRIQEFMNGTASGTLPRTSYPLGVEPTDLHELLPGYLTDALRQAMLGFEKTIPGFGGQDGVMIAPETRTTSPVRFDRDERQCSTTVEGLYPIGEGAGYAGGIVSSALDGLRSARAILLQHT